ncbi:class I SAM-dependent methyltransferase [Sulfuricaulis sp.]|uniref:class I SAM-dependent methyltransferase n=1 Tax=Sulfuricaulis sp. TaxID=2003553 RepID=UPI003C71E984
MEIALVLATEDALEHECCTMHLRRLRRAEISRLRNLLEPRRRILELGGSDGFQAAILSSWGHDVTSLDVASPVPGAMQFHPVMLYDGKRIPYGDCSCDVVFSSHVLEHAQALDRLLRESSRVLEPGGLAIHILPSPAWRFWTSIAHYAYVALRGLGLRRPIPGGLVPSVAEKMQHRSVWYVIKRTLLAGPHGEYPSALSEMYYFSKSRWLKVFCKNGFEVTRVVAGGLFYTGYGLFPRLSLEVREKMANVMGSATYIYVLRKE